MAEVDLRVIGGKEWERLAREMPKVFAQARKSALSSAGFRFYEALRNHIEYGGTEDEAPLSPFASRLQKTKKGKWTKRRDPKIPLFWLAKWARYRIGKDGLIMSADFGKGRKGTPGILDPQIAPAVGAAAKERKVQVTKSMRRKFGATRKKRSKVGVDYFPLKASTKYITIPERQLVSPVEKKIMPEMPKFFAEKFWASFERNLKRATK